MIVIDASALLETLLDPSVAAALHKKLTALGEFLCAPHLIDLEITHALRRRVGLRQLASDRAIEALSDLSALRIDRYPHLGLLKRVWELRQNLTAYDAIYVALAEELDAPLITQDLKLASAPGHSAIIELL
ncbi:MAG: type II toxin-antitoxin system VapC family toxin [Alphaproteobacteria bacterium]